MSSGFPNRMQSLTAGIVTLSLGIGWAAAQSPPGSILSGIFTAPQADRGRAAYMKSCASCHGASLVSRDDSAPSLTAVDFADAWQGKTVGEKYERIRASMPLETPGSLSEQEYADIVAHILRVNGYPAGETELKPDLAALKAIRIEPVKP